MNLTDRQKHDIADRLALWVSAALDLHGANDLMRQSIREWLDFQSSDAFPLPENVLAFNSDSAFNEREAERRERRKWTTKQWYEHVGAWETPEGHITFGSVMALVAMLIQFQRAHQVAIDDAERYRYLATLRDWRDIELACWSTPAESADEFKKGLDKYIDGKRFGGLK